MKLQYLLELGGENTELGKIEALELLSTENYNPKIILDESGSSWDNLVDVTVFLTNMKSDFHIYNRIYAEYFSDNLPCRTTVEVLSLPTPIAIELKCVATIK